MFRKKNVPLAVAAAVSLLLVFAAIVGAMFVFNQQPRKQSEMSLELFKVFLQLPVIGVIGALVSELYRRIQMERDRRQRDSELSSDACKDYMRRLGSAYRTAKGVRRMIKASGLTTQTPLAAQTSSEFKFYEVAMKRLNKTQLELEALKIEAGARPEFVQIEGLENNLKLMESYLRQILKEYEGKRSALKPSAQFDFGELRLLGQFSDGGICAESAFFTPYEQCIRSISKYLLAASR